MKLTGRKILVGITGGIAAYKTIELIRMFKRDGADVKVVMTSNALSFVTEKTIETISGNPLYIEQFEEKKTTVHISLEKWCDVFVIAPASLNTISKIAVGVADNLLTSVAAAILGTKKPIVIAPAMNSNMWENENFQDNLKKLRNRCEIVEPQVGFLACGDVGCGRLADINLIYQKTLDVIFANCPLKNKKIIITAGGTREFIDPVRVITNLSSGKMGLALSDCAFRLGAEVELISTFDVERDYEVKKVDTAIEMKNLIEKDFLSADVLIMASAVADYRIKNYSEEKLSGHDDTLTLEFVKNPDILEGVSKIKKDNQTTIGFCLSTNNPNEFGKEKIQKKKCDYIVANQASVALGSNLNEVWIIDKNLVETKLELDTKENIAYKILELLYD